MYIEDLIRYMSFSSQTMKPYDEKIIHSFDDQISRGSSLTEKQGTLAVRLLKKYSSALGLILKADPTPYLSNPQYKLALRKINNSKRIFIAEDSLYGKSLNVELPYNQEFIEAVRKNKSKLGPGGWDHDKKVWKFGLSEDSIRFFSDLTDQYGLDVDDEFSDYRNQIVKILNSIENVAPMLTLVNNEPYLVNIPPQVPAINSKNPISAIFEARKYGIYTWDDTITPFFEKNKVNEITRLFLEEENTSGFHVDSKTNPIECLTDIVKNTEPTLFVIPGGLELSKLKLVVGFLRTLGYAESEMSVMFRLPSSTGKEFNEFVKNNQLNNPISEKTRFVFISIKLPKPVLESKMIFNSVISLGHSNVHYTVREYFKNCQNLVYYYEQAVKKDYSFETM